MKDFPANITIILNVLMSLTAITALLFLLTQCTMHYNDLAHIEEMQQQLVNERFMNEELAANQELKLREVEVKKLIIYKLGVPPQLLDEIEMPVSFKGEHKE